MNKTETESSIQRTKLIDVRWEGVGWLVKNGERIKNYKLAVIEYSGL